MDQQVLDLVYQNLAEVYGFPWNLLKQGRISHFSSDSNNAVWTPHGGVVACVDEALAHDIAEAVSQHVGDDYAALFWKLHATLKRHLPAGYDLREAYALEQIKDRTPGQPIAVCNLNVYLHCDTAPQTTSEMRDRIEVLRPADVWPDCEIAYDHIFAIREGGVLASRAWNRPSRIGEHRFHAFGAYTRREHQGKGLAKVVTAALLEHVVSEGGIALWSVLATNIPSLRLARSLGFVEDSWHFNWEVEEGRVVPE